MAIVKTFYGALRVDQLPEYGNAITASDTLITIADNVGNMYSYFGQFTYDQNGPHGPVDTIRFTVDGKVNFTVEGVTTNVDLLVGEETTVEQAVEFVLGSDDIIYGRNENDVMAGAGGNDRLIGKGGSDTLFGNDGNDILLGGDDIDYLIGGSGADRLTGGSAADIFAYLSASDSTAMGTGRDRILDFNSAEGDKIDLRLIDGNPFGQLTVVQAFDRHAGQVTITETGTNVYLVLADLDGNGRADFGISVFTTGATPTLSANDFLL